MRYFIENALYGSETQTWRCLLCDYTRGDYRRYQVFGHIAANHGYTSRTPNERRGIRIQDKYTEEQEHGPPQDLQVYMIAEIDNQRIRILKMNK